MLWPTELPVLHKKEVWAKGPQEELSVTQKLDEP